MEWHMVWKVVILVIIAVLAVKVILDFKREPHEEDN